MKKTAINLLILVMTVLLALSAASCGGNKAGGREQTSADEQEEEQIQEEEPGNEEEVPEVKAEDMLDRITVNTQSSIRIEGSKDRRQYTSILSKERRLRTTRISS